MRPIVVPIYDSYVQPTEILSYYIIKSEDNINLYNNAERPDTPYWRCPVRDITEFISDDITILNKKLFFKYVMQYEDEWEPYEHLKDLGSLLWHYDQNPVEINFADYELQPATYFLNKVLSMDFSVYRELSDLELPTQYDYLNRACAILDGYISVDGEAMYKCYDHYSSTGRFRDRGASTLSMKKEKRQRIRRKGVLVEFDMESFHLRILNELIEGGMPDNVRGHDWIVENSNLDPESDDSKADIFKAIYSENFDMVQHSFFRRIKSRYKQLKSPLRRQHKNFNYIIQEHEVLIMSKIINKLYPHCNEILLYLYDGLYFDVDPNGVKEFISQCKQNIDLPFTLKIGETEKRFA